VWPVVNNDLIQSLRGCAASVGICAELAVLGIRDFAESYIERRRIVLVALWDKAQNDRIVRVLCGPDVFGPADIWIRLGSPSVLSKKDFLKS